MSPDRSAARIGVRRRDVLVVVLTVTTGTLDVVSYLRPGKVLSRVITGNLVLAGGSRRPAGRGPGAERWPWPAARRPALLGVTAGAGFGLTAALMKGMTETFAGDFGKLFTSWQLYATIAAGVGGMFLVQWAMNAGRLLAAQPGLTLSDPVVSILWGVLVFQEQVRGGVYLALAALSGLVMAVAVVYLARFPLLSGPAADQEGEAAPRQPDPSTAGKNS